MHLGVQNRLFPTLSLPGSQMLVAVNGLTETTKKIKVSAWYVRGRSDVHFGGDYSRERLSADWGTLATADSGMAGSIPSSSTDIFPKIRRLKHPWCCSKKYLCV